MKEYTDIERQSAIEVLISTIRNCEKMVPKFKEGTSQHSLLRKRIKALMISKALLSDEDTTVYSEDELNQALPPIISIIHKCRKAQEKYAEGTKQFLRFQKIIDPMLVSKDYLESALKEFPH